MSRPNKPREVFAENYLAERIARERETRGWSLEGLAKRMCDAGCAINQSAIYKIEQGQPRRRITVDELVGFSRVFGIPVSKLLLDPEIEASDRAVALLEEWRLTLQARATAIAASDTMLEVLQRQLAELTDSPAALKAIKSRLKPAGLEHLVDYFKKGGK